MITAIGELLVLRVRFKLNLDLHSTSDYGRSLTITRIALNADRAKQALEERTKKMSSKLS